MRNSTRKPKGKPRLRAIFVWEGLKNRAWVLGLDFFGPDYGQVVQPVEQGNEHLSYAKYGKFID
jgi:hypothetical protein